MSKRYKFKKGDKVFCRNDQYTGLEKGKIYTVEKHEGDFVHCKELECGYFDFCFEPSADYLFEKLEYEKDTTYLAHLDYRKSKIEKIIQFRDDKTIGIFNYEDKFEPITMQELQAINEKVKELGWNE